MDGDSNDYRYIDLSTTQALNIDAILEGIQKTNQKPITDVASFNNWREDAFRYRNTLLNKLLKAYSDYKTESYREMKLHRKFFFWVMTALLLILTAGLLAGFIWLVPALNDTGAIITSLVTMAAAYISSLFGILQIIAKYLFPDEGVKQDTEFLKIIAFDRPKNDNSAADK